MKEWQYGIGDEMLTPDSSRFWPAEGYEPGHGQPSFDKQFARDWLKAIRKVITGHLATGYRR